MDKFDRQRAPTISEDGHLLKAMDKFDRQRAPTISEDGHLFKSDGQIRQTTSPHN